MSGAPLPNPPAQVDGSIQVKSYLAGNPPIKVKLNDDLIIGARGASAGTPCTLAGGRAPGRALVALVRAASAHACRQAGWSVMGWARREVSGAARVPSACVRPDAHAWRSK